MPEQITIILADDHPVVRQGLRQIVEADRDLLVVGEASDGAEALRIIETEKPDVAVLDIDMPEKDGFSILAEIEKKRLDCRVIFLTFHSDEDVFLSAMDRGVKGYILKDSGVKDIVQGIKTVAKGGFYVTPSLSSHLLSRRKSQQKLSENLPQLEALTPTERQVLRLVSEYKTSKEIAGELFVHYRTIENHRTNICQKLGITGHNALLKFALKNKNMI